MSEYVEIKKTWVDYCQVCSKKFKDIELCYYAPIDNNIVCSECSKIHKDKQLRIYLNEK